MGCFKESVTTKACSKCKSKKPTDDFPMKDKFHRKSSCRDCTNLSLRKVPVKEKPKLQVMFELSDQSSDWPSVIYNLMKTAKTLGHTAEESDQNVDLDQLLKRKNKVEGLINSTNFPGKGELLNA